LDRLVGVVEVADEVLQIVHDHPLLLEGVGHEEQSGAGRVGRQVQVLVRVEAGFDVHGEALQDLGFQRDVVLVLLHLGHGFVYVAAEQHALVGLYAFLVQGFVLVEFYRPHFLVVLEFDLLVGEVHFVEEEIGLVLFVLVDHLLYLIEKHFV